MPIPRARIPRSARVSGDRASRGYGGEEITTVVNRIVDLLDDNRKEEGRREVEKLVQVVRDSAAAERRESGEDEPITRGDLRDLLDTALRSRPQTDTPPSHPASDTQLGRDCSANTEQRRSMAASDGGARGEVQGTGNTGQQRGGNAAQPNATRDSISSRHGHGREQRCSSPGDA
jgi:hypothetical protein